VLPGVAAAAASHPNSSSAAPASSKRSHKPAANPPPPAAAPAGAPSQQAAVEPIWPEPLPPQPPIGPGSAAMPAQPNPLAVPGSDGGAAPAARGQ
jgi:hypothetical protein